MCLQSLVDESEVEVVLDAVRLWSGSGKRVIGWTHLAMVEVCEMPRVCAVERADSLESSLLYWCLSSRSCL